MLGTYFKYPGVPCRMRRGPDERHPMFVATRGERLTRFGAIYIVRRAVKRAAARDPSLAQVSISPHLLRHSLAMQLLQSGTDLVTIQAWLGHANVATTHHYAEANVEMMRRSLELAAVTPSRGQRFRPRDSVLKVLESI